VKKSQFETLIREVIRETIRKVDGKYVVYPEKGGKRLGTHSTKAAAEKQLTAIHLNKEDIREAFKKGKVIIYHNFQGVDVDENVPGTNKVLNISDCIGNEPAKDYNYFTTEKKQYVEDMIKDASGEGWKKFPPVLAIPHPIVSGKYSVIDGNHRLGAFTIGKLPQINARILSEDKIELAERGAEWDENKLPKTLPLADAKKQGVDLKEYFATQPLKVPSNENYADGKVKGKSRPGRVKRSGASCKGSVTDLRAKAKKYGGEKGKMYHWCANMKGGKK